MTLQKPTTHCDYALGHAAPDRVNTRGRKDAAFATMSNFLAFKQQSHGAAPLRPQ